MRICFVTSALPDVPCGIGDYTSMLAEALSRAGQDVFVITTSSPHLLPNSSYSIVPLDTDWSAGQAKLIADAAMQLHPDVVHVQFPGASYGRGFGATLLPWHLRFRRQRPGLVATLHEFHVFRFRFRARMAAGFSASDLVISPDPIVLASVRRMLRFRPGLQTRLIPIGTNIVPTSAPGAGPEVDLRRRPDELIVGHWGFLRADKGIESLVEAFARVRGVRAARLVLAGDPGPNTEYARRIDALIAERGLADDVLITGRLESDQISAVLSDLDVCVLPYRDGLAQNRTTYAAMVAHGGYTVTTRVGDAGYDPNTNTMFVAPGDAEAIAKAILEASDHPRREPVRGDVTSWDDVARLHLEAYGAIGRKPRS
jgi:glycosyltransferase involved in cell wall biosynthesis